MWQTHITVAAIIEQQQQFILVTDSTPSGDKLNQPAGHVEANEDIIAAIIREVKEETSLDFIPQKITGLYWYHPNPEHSYLRVCFSGTITNLKAKPQPQAADDGVIAAAWYSWETIKARAREHRSPLVLRCLEDYLAGKEFPLELLTNCRAEFAVV